MQLVFEKAPFVSIISILEGTNNSFKVHYNFTGMNLSYALKAAALALPFWALTTASGQIDTAITGHRQYRHVNWSQLAGGSVEEGPDTTCEAVSHRGVVYEVTRIGNQCWFAKSMRATSMADGTWIGNGNTDWATTSASGPAFAYSGAKDCFVYNAAAAAAVCPSPFHLPTYADYSTMRSTLISDFGLTGSNVATAIKTPDWGGVYQNYSGWTAMSASYNYNLNADGSDGAGNGQYWAQGRKYMRTRGGGGMGVMDLISVQADAAYGMQVRCVKTWE